MGNPSFEVDQCKDAGSVCKCHEQVRLRIEQGLSLEDNGEFNQAHQPEENADYSHALVQIYVLFRCLIVAKRYGYLDVVLPRLEDYRHGHHLQDQSDELGLLENARVLFHFEFIFKIEIRAELAWGFGVLGFWGFDI